jgi:hypothetical protein
MSKLTTRDRHALPAIEFAFPAQRKEPLEKASHIRNAITRFTQMAGVNDAERNVARERIQRSAKKYGVDVHDTSWRDLGKSNA